MVLTNSRILSDIVSNHQYAGNNRQNIGDWIKKRHIDPLFTRALIGMSALSLSDPLESRTLADGVTRRLREAILSGELQPGQELRQEKIAANFGVSRVPVREALRVLAAEGLITLRSHHSATITKLSKADVQELVLIAGALDLAAVHRGVPQLTDGDLARMKACIEEMESLEDNPAAWLSLNLEFHLITTEASMWPRLQAMVVESRRNIGRFVTPMFYRCVNDWHAQHKAIYEACKARDAELVKRELDAHWQYTVNTIDDEAGASFIEEDYG